MATAPSGSAPPTVIQTDGIDRAWPGRNIYFLDTTGSGTGPEAEIWRRRHHGWASSVPAGRRSARFRVAGGGYDVAWKNHQPASTRCGALTVTATICRTSSALFPATARRWNARDHLQPGPQWRWHHRASAPPTVIQTDGIDQPGHDRNNYVLDTTGGDSRARTLKYGGAAVTAGQFGRLDADWRGSGCRRRL